MPDSGVYLISCAANGSVYVGSSHDLHERRRYHWANLKSGVHRNPRLQATWNKYGESAFRFEVIEAVDNREHLLAVEQSLLDYYRRLKPKQVMNIASFTTAPMRGRRHSVEALQRQSEVKRGKRHSEESKRRISESNRASLSRPEARKKRSDWSTARWSDPKKREAHRESFRKDMRPIERINPDTGEIVLFESLQAAERAGFTRSNVRRAAKRPGRSAYGFLWQYAEVNA